MLINNRCRGGQNHWKYKACETDRLLFFSFGTMIRGRGGYGAG